MPKTKDGGIYELDFKIDAYRNQIQLKKPSGQKKMMSQTNAAELIKRTMRKKDSNRTKQLAFEINNENSMQQFSTYNSLQSEFDKQAQLQSIAQSYILSLGGCDMYMDYNATESLSKIPNY